MKWVLYVELFPTEDSSRKAEVALLFVIDFSQLWESLLIIFNQHFCAVGISEV